MNKKMLNGFTALALSIGLIGSVNAAVQSKKQAEKVDESIVKSIKAGFASAPGLPLGGVPDEIIKSEIPGLYQVVHGTNVYFMSANGQYFIQGNVIDVKTGNNVSDLKIAEISSNYLKTLDIKDAIKIVNGNGQRIIYSFEDPSCGYCKKLHQEITALKNVTIYTYTLSFLGEQSAEKSKRILCAANKNRAELWSNTMLDKPTAGDASCEAGAISLAKNNRHAQKLGVIGTPTLIFADGSRIGGYVTSDEIEKRLTH